MKYITIILLSFFITSCSTAKQTTNTNTTNTEEESLTKSERQQKILSDAGFIKAIVVDKKGENNCGYLLKTENNKLYIPVAWIVPEYRVEGKEIYIKFTDSKAPQNGCSEATPIVLEAMKLIKS